MKKIVKLIAYSLLLIIITLFVFGLTNVNDETLNKNPFISKVLNFFKNDKFDEPNQDPYIEDIITEPTENVENTNELIDEPNQDPYIEDIITEPTENLENTNQQATTTDNTSQDIKADLTIKTDNSLIDIGKISDSKYAGILKKSDKQNTGNMNYYNLYIGQATILIGTARNLDNFLGQNMTIVIEGSIENFILKNIYPTTAKINADANNSNLEKETLPYKTLAQTGFGNIFLLFFPVIFLLFSIKKYKRQSLD